MGVKEDIIDFCEENVTLYSFSNIGEYKDEIVSDDLRHYNYALVLE